MPFAQRAGNFVRKFDRIA